MSDFTLDSYSLKTRVKRLDGKPFDPSVSVTVLAVYNHGSVPSRLIRVLPTKGSRGEQGALNSLGTYYLAGPMRGYPMFNFPLFLMAGRILTARGLTILSPAEKDMEAGFDPSRPIEGQKFDIHASFRWDFDAVVKSDGIILLPGWENSTGAKAERVVAQLCGRPAYELDKDFNLREARPADYNLTWEIEAQPLPALTPIDQ